MCKSLLFKGTEKRPKGCLRFRGGGVLVMLRLVIYKHRCRRWLQPRGEWVVEVEEVPTMARCTTQASPDFGDMSPVSNRPEPPEWIKTIATQASK
jgi:hypothetical protein